MKTHTIYSTYDMYSEENMRDAKENIIENMFFDADEDGTITITDNYGKEVTVTREEYSKTITEEKLYDECSWNNQTWFNDTKNELCECDRGELVAIADVGRWNGRCSGYKIIKSLPDVLYTDCDDEELYVDSNGDLHKSESHHDGSNSILYRYWKEGLSDIQKENFLDKIYNGECTQKDITRYTRKAGTEIAELFGWKVRGIKKVA
jgi:hypothetical protein